MLSSFASPKLKKRNVPRTGVKMIKNGGEKEQKTEGKVIKEAGARTI